MQRAIYQSSIPAPTAEKHLEHLTRFQITCPDIIKCSRGASEDHSFIECTMCPIFKERRSTLCCCCVEFKCILLPPEPGPETQTQTRRQCHGDSDQAAAVLSSLRPHTKPTPWRQERAQQGRDKLLVRYLFRCYKVSLLSVSRIV